MSFQSTPWQTVGPYYRLGLEPLYRVEIAPTQAQGERVQVQREHEVLRVVAPARPVERGEQHLMHW